LWLDVESLGSCGLASSPRTSCTDRGHLLGHLSGDLNLVGGEMRPQAVRTSATDGLEQTTSQRAVIDHELDRHRSDMHRGERQCTFAFPPSSHVNWLLLLAHLLDGENVTHSDPRDPFFRLHSLLKLVSPGSWVDEEHQILWPGQAQSATILYVRQHMPVSNSLCTSSPVVSTLLRSA
jgi:hypothetical protein